MSDAPGPDTAGLPPVLWGDELAPRWPGAEGAPSDAELWRRLDEAVARRLLRREGPGHKGSPYRYWLPGQEEQWKDDPLPAVHESIWQAEAAAREMLDEPARRRRG